MMARKNMRREKMSGGDVRQIDVPVQNKRQCISEDG
jgi:hypothetical protein